MADVYEGKWYTIREVAERLRVTRQAVTQWIHEGKLPAWRAGPKRVLIAEEAIEELLRPIEPRKE